MGLGLDDLERQQGATADLPGSRISEYSTHGDLLITHIVSRKLNISKNLTPKAQFSRGPTLVVIARRLCKYERTAPAQPMATGVSISMELDT